MSHSHNEAGIGQIPVTSILGVEVSKLDMRSTVDVLERAVASGKPHQIITANPIMIMAALESEDNMRAMREAELIVPDGAGVVWAAEEFGDPVAERVAGFDLLQELMKRGEQLGWSAYLLGAAEEVVQEAASRLQKQYPKVRIAGVRNGYFGESENAEIIANIREAKPDLLFVARDAKTQEPWIARYKEEIGVPVIMGVGGSFDVISGKTKRAPVFMQKLRLEWFYRLAKEPSRLPRMMALPRFMQTVKKAKKSMK
ncbi:WecB/TagA/CpsF family glycosyltransferase [Saccharibacillus alkalitolerans]|uniref:N-acetylglucosaminyldiphosphoundecaprenol N-acetyl-beta-D-mannosaminyltransferase n=1 Tax=Saccharibacillus alkalitolerans TaxID=2705290 RepID=A0ABX0F8B0_9BACL|nr:WecB/TagA/CpsF family glycosyltransferase [Saccharibacillus alkalitolerans]NGZ76140.1 WecB/TagA/CpsF family glycosyltransferase [Saccharibacillus alkalitolerans]